MKSTFYKIIEEVCKEYNIKCTLLSKDWVIMLKQNDKIRFISGYKFCLNDHALGSIVDDKYAFFEVMKTLNIPIIEHEILFPNNNINPYAIGNNSTDCALRYFHDHNKEIVVKSNTGTCGTEVFLIKSKTELIKKLNKLFKNNFSISMCPYYHIKREYRVIVLNKKIELIYYKIRPIVTGDGKSTIRQLLLDFNYNYFINKLQDSKYNKVLKDKKTFSYGWQFNLSQGSIAKLSEDETINRKITKIIKDLINNIHLKFGSVDIIETEDNKLMLMEANSGVMMNNFVSQIENGYCIAKDIYKKAILEMFK